MIVLLALLLLVLCMVVGIPIPLSFLASAALVCLVDGSSPIMLFSYGFNNMNSVLLLSIPLFVLAGSLIDKGGLGEKLIGGLYKLCRGSKAALGTVTVIACAVFGAVSGSSSATLSCIGSIMEPRLREAGYKPGLIGGLLASSGVLGIMIPPSILMILYAWGTGASVLACFLSTIIPGIILVVLFSLVNAYFVKKTIPATASAGPAPAAAAAVNTALDGKKKKEKSAIPAILMPILLLGSIYTGALTATEGAAFTVLYSAVVGALFYRRLDRASFKEAMI